MVDLVWLGLIVGGILTAAWHHNVGAVTQAAMAAAGKAVDIAFGFIGIMTLWLGLARVAEDSGLMRLLARALEPLFRRLFPSLPAGHPAIGSMAMNIVANMLGMGGAATPFGLKAMEELARVNPEPRRASADMITFIAINTAALNLVPATMIALRVAAGSKDPTAVVGPTVLVTGITTVVVITADRLIRRRNRE